MSRTLDLSKATSTAIECSYYVAPDQPGLTPTELATVHADLGFQQGEIQDELDGGHASS